MSHATEVASPAVPPEEVARRIAEYRRIGYLRHIPAHVVYQPPKDICPWPDCEAHIVGINFQLDQMGDPDYCADLLKSWWVGPGLVANCPICQRRVLYSLIEKLPVSASLPAGAGVLPDDWAQRAHVVRSK